MAYREHYSGFEYNQSIDPVTLTADADGATVDTRGFDSTTILFLIGESGDTLSASDYIELEVEDSPDDSAWTDCENADLTNFETGTTNTGTIKKVVLGDDDEQYSAGYIGDKRYVRPVVNVTGTHTNGTPIGAAVINGHAHNTPVNAPA